SLLEAPSIRPVSAARIFLGAPNSIKGPTEVVFQRQSGNNLLIVGQREEAMLAILSVALVSLAAQYPRGQGNERDGKNGQHRLFALPHDQEIIPALSLEDHFGRTFDRVGRAEENARGGNRPNRGRFE